jgi:hypothetical protein
MQSSIGPGERGPPATVVHLAQVEEHEIGWRLVVSGPGVRCGQSERWRQLAAMALTALLSSRMAVPAMTASACRAAMIPTRRTQVSIAPWMKTTMVPTAAGEIDSSATASLTSRVISSSFGTSPSARISAEPVLSTCS